MEFLFANIEDSCSVLNEISSMQMATLSTGKKGDIGIPITSVKPSHYRIFDLNTLILLVVHTYHTDLAEPNNVHYPHTKQIDHSFEIIQIDL